MKTKIIVNVFTKRKKEEKSLMVKVMDSIIIFKRKIELLPSFKELKEINDEYHKSEQKIVKKLIKRYCDEENEKNGFKEKPVPVEKKKGEDINAGDLIESPDVKYLDDTNVLQVPEKYAKEYLDELDTILKTKLKIKKLPLFSNKEIEESGIFISEIERMEGFMLGR